MLATTCRHLVRFIHVNMYTSIIHTQKRRPAHSNSNIMPLPQQYEVYNRTLRTCKGRTATEHCKRRGQGIELFICGISGICLILFFVCQSFQSPEKSLTVSCQHLFGALPSVSNRTSGHKNYNLLEINHETIFIKISLLHITDAYTKIKG